MGFCVETLNTFNITYRVWMQWSFLPGEQVQRTSGPIDVLYLLSRRSLKVKLRGPVCPTMNKVILEATSRVFRIYTGILLRYGCERDIWAQYIVIYLNINLLLDKVSMSDKNAEPCLREITNQASFRYRWLPLWTNHLLGWPWTLLPRFLSCIRKSYPKPRTKCWLLTTIAHQLYRKRIIFTRLHSPQNPPLFDRRPLQSTKPPSRPL